MTEDNIISNDTSGESLTNKPEPVEEEEKIIEEEIKKPIKKKTKPKKKVVKPTYDEMYPDEDGFVEDKTNVIKVEDAKLIYNELESLKKHVVASISIGNPTGAIESINGIILKFKKKIL